MPGIATSRNLSMDIAGLIGRASGAGKSTILDAAAVRSYTSTLTDSEVASLISAAVGAIDLSGYLPLTGGTLSGNLGVTNIVGPGGSTTLVLNNAGTGGTYLQENGASRAWIGGSGLGIYTAAYPMNSNLYDLGLTTRYWRKLFVSCIVPLSADLIIRDGTTAQAVRIDKTYTSDTNCEYLRVGFTGTNYDIASMVGSAGGSNQPIRLGHIAADGTTFVGPFIDTNGYLNVKRILGDSASPSGFTFSTGLALLGGQLGWTSVVGGGGNVLSYSTGNGLLQFVAGGNIPMVRFALGQLTSATAPAFKPYSGGVEIRAANDSATLSLTCAAITASGNLLLQNSTTAVIAELSKTFTSSTNREYLQVGFSGTNYDLCSRVGSAGGSNQPLRLGHIAADGTTFAGLTVATTGGITTTGDITTPGTTTFAANGVRCGGIAIGRGSAGGLAGEQINLFSNSVRKVSVVGSAVNVASDGSFSFRNNVNNSVGATDCALIRNSTTQMAVLADSGVAVRNFANSADAAVTCSAITASGNLTYVPPSSVTLGTNGQFAVEMTSNTAGNLVYRGSDGTTRRMALTFV